MLLKDPNRKRGNAWFRHVRYMAMKERKRDDLLTRLWDWIEKKGWKNDVNRSSSGVG
jgi:hypothetical protein